ncbi:MAG: hypothetical protein KBT47_06315 [Armatimonadetes bacterium]|nr:hypothetical protein [Candidatus Hippobium faecium]
MTKQERNDLIDKVALQLQKIGWNSDGYPNNKEGVLLEDIITELTKN